MQLEIISKKPKNWETRRKTSKKPKLVFVHGICVGAWIWDEHFLPYFAKHGYEAHALSLRGHGKSEGVENLPSWRLSDYVEDLDNTIELLDGPVIVIGHSMGGAVVQDWLKHGRQRNRAVGGVLLASVPPWGLAYSNLRMLFSHPSLFIEMGKAMVMGAKAMNKDIVRRSLFSNNVPKAISNKFIDLICDESAVASSEVQGMRQFAPLPWEKRPPMFVGGTTNDHFIPVEEVRRTAVYYDTDAVIIPNLEHSIMVDTNWEKMAQPLLEWIENISGKNVDAKP